ncbi:MAG: hypothetical protein ACR2KV_17445 [Solirubrobacteraceae bacterium]
MIVPEEPTGDPAPRPLATGLQGGSTAAVGPYGDAGGGVGRRLPPVFALTGALILIWLLWSPRSPDLAAQAYRVALFAREGFSVWDNAWYGGHYLPDYSLAFPPLAALIGTRLVGAASVLISVLLFERLAELRFGRRARPAALVFAVGAAGDLYIGRLTFALGVTFAIAAVLAAARDRRWPVGILSIGCAAASPVAALFLVLLAGADLLANRRVQRAALLGLPALTLALTMAVLFPEGGRQTFYGPSVLAAFGVPLLMLWLLPVRERLLRCGVGLYLLAVLASYVFATPMGSNVVRLGVLLAAPILAGAVGAEDMRRALGRVTSAAGLLQCLRPAKAGGRRLIRAVPARPALIAVVVGMIAWQVNGPLAQSLEGVGDPSLQSSYYLPVSAFLAAQTHGRPMRIEVPFTRSHWDATVLGRRFDLARGWERQLDTKYDGLFYLPRLTPAAYAAWLADTGVRFVALSDAPLDDSSKQEAALVRGGLPFLRPVFASRHWRVYAVGHPTPLASGPGRLVSIDLDGFTVQAARPGTFTVRLHFTPYWAVVAGSACVTATPAGWTQLTAAASGVIRVDALFSLGRILTSAPACSPVSAG